MKTLVCLLGQVRLAEHTWEPFKKYVLDELHADLVLCGNVCVQNEFTAHAKHIFKTLGDPDPEYWKPWDDITGFMGTTRSQSYGRNLVELRRILFENIKDLGQWDQVIVSRTDHLWTGPHPKLDLDHIWCLNGEFHGGICDRHMVIPWRFLEGVLTVGIFEDISKTISFVTNYYNRTFAWRGALPFGMVNIEGFMFIRMVERGLIQHVGLTPFPMYLMDQSLGPKFLDEIDPDPQTLTWPFQIDHTFVSKNGMFQGRALKIV
jgi:hypothetical protein